MDNEKSLRVYQMMEAIDSARRAWKCAHPGTYLTKSEFFTLMVLYRRGQCQGGGRIPMTLSKLSEAMEQTMPAVSQRVTKLESLGYLERQADEKDRRTVWISLTDIGLSTLEEARSTMFHHMEQVIDTMEKHHAGSVQSLIDGCNSLVDALHEEFPQ